MIYSRMVYVFGCELRISYCFTTEKARSCPSYLIYLALPRTRPHPRHAMRKPISMEVSVLRQYCKPFYETIQQAVGKVVETIAFSASYHCGSLHSCRIVLNTSTLCRRQNQSVLYQINYGGCPPRWLGDASKYESTIHLIKTNKPDRSSISLCSIMATLHNASRQLYRSRKRSRVQVFCI